MAGALKWPPSLISLMQDVIYMTMNPAMPPTFYDPEILYLQYLKSNLVEVNVHTGPYPAPRVITGLQTYFLRSRWVVGALKAAKRAKMWAK